MVTHSTDPESEQPEPPVHGHLRQLALQCAAAFAVLSVTWPYYGLRGATTPWPETAFVIGGVGLLFAIVSNQHWWWRLIHALFAPLAWVVSTLSLNPNWFLATFVLMFLIYRGAVTSQVPLFLSNRKTIAKLSDLAESYPNMCFVDLGAGLGNVVKGLAILQPQAQLTGIENAPASWLIGYFRTFRQANCSWRFGDIWDMNLKDFDVAYTFLSPVPMPAMWEKVQREMRPGSLFISNSFPIPGIEPDKIVEIDDPRKTTLFCYLR